MKRNEFDLLNDKINLVMKAHEELKQRVDAIANLILYWQKHLKEAFEKL